MKPGPSAATITYLPIASPAAHATAKAASEDSMPATTSSSRITGGGLKKCIPTTREASPAAPASAVTSSDEVLVASTQSGLTTSARAANRARLSSSRSGAASMTSPHAASASSVSAGCSRSEAAAAASSLQRPRSAPRFS